MAQRTISKVHFSSNFSEGFQAFRHNIFYMTDTQANGEKSPSPNPNYGSGYLEISEKGFGFLRTAQNHFHPNRPIFLSRQTRFAAIFCAKAATSKVRHS